MWRHDGGMSCACPGRLEVSRGIVEAKHVTLERHLSSAVDLTNTNSCQLNSTNMTPTNCSRITSPCLLCALRHSRTEGVRPRLSVCRQLVRCTFARRCWTEQRRIAIVVVSGWHAGAPFCYIESRAGGPTGVQGGASIGIPAVAVWAIARDCGSLCRKRSWTSMRQG